MRDFRINLNRYYQERKEIIWFIVIIVILVSLVTSQMAKIRNKSGNSSNVTTVSDNSNNSTTNTYKQVVNEIVEKNENQTNETVENNNKKIEESISSSEECIEAFISLCNNGQTTYAYNLLSDDCKELLYPTEQDFIDKYYSVIFKTHKVANVVSFKNHTYKVDYAEEDISLGKNSSSVVTDYITVSNKKINISEFIEKTNLTNKISNQYVSIEVTSRLVYLNYELYTINVKNLTKADIYINNVNDSNLFLYDSYGNKFEISNEEYAEDDYKISSEGSKSIQLKFMRSYNINESITQMVFKNIIIKNKLYYDSSSATNTSTNGDVIYDRKMTTYPNKTEVTIEL